MYQRIFVPVDNSEASFLALTEACKLAKVSGGQLRIVHVANMNQPGWGNTDFVPDTDMQQVADEQSEILLQAKQLAQSFDVESECKVIKNWVDKIPLALAEDAKAWQADLIVMNTHGWSGLKRLLLGSVAEGLLRAVTIPTLLIRATDDR
ncbi:universal stress protein [Paludibacterium purpuratum]|uniref:Nucleotide-binding universal stress UspA family protein n=1 Tax=Paludibacterium purpuratum TaxID=1144873 RepID=A0A4R7AZJ5_9NEIS|nr:universal stress protein [Paludibacterium purpuratum]TDR73861.1 nucleotide-binding universal stress UspA family protein [Paludibacterium purpuratum]